MALREHYRLFKEAILIRDSVRNAMFIAIYRNMELYVGEGDLQRGTNFYVNWKNGTKSGLIGWKNLPFNEVLQELNNFKLVK